MRTVSSSLLVAVVGAASCPESSAYDDLPVKKSSLKLRDAVRERDISAVVWRPAASEGPFPFVSINHGAGMAADSSVEGGYGYLAEAFAARGYVVAAWNEYSVIGSQLDYILDSAAIRDSMYNASADSTHEFHGLLCDRAVAVGHSLGGGAEFVSSDREVMRNCGGQTPCHGGYTASYQGVAALSGGFKWDMDGTPNPYAIAPRLKIPALFVSGTEDCMVKPLEENYPMYTNMTQSPCRIFANVTGADHCQWAGLSRIAQASCVALEKATFPCKPSLSAREQQAFALKYVLPFLESITKGNTAALTGLLANLVEDESRGDVIHEFEGCTDVVSFV